MQIPTKDEINTTSSCNKASVSAHVERFVSGKRITVNEKLMSKIDKVISESLCLVNMEEFELFENWKLFQNPPEEWTDIEKAICDYTGRINVEISEKIRKLFIDGNSR